MTQKYRTIASAIRNRILTRDFEANEQLPFERDLCTDYGVSKMTVKKALDMLVSEGLIVKRRGAGTYVKDLAGEEIDRLAVSTQFRGTSALNPDKVVRSKILDFKVIKSPEIISKKLNIPEGSFVYDIHRVRYIDGNPHVIEKMYMPIELIPYLKNSHIESSLYAYIENGLGLKIQSAHRRISVRTASALESEYLALKGTDPVAIAEQIAYFDTGQAFEYSLSTHRYDEFSVAMILTRE
jgi:GntR family transcriptional regulator